MQANSSEVPAACEIKLIRDFPPLIYWLQSPSLPWTRPCSWSQAPSPSTSRPLERVGGESPCRAKLRLQVGRHTGTRVRSSSTEDPGRERRSHPTWLSSAGAPPAGPQGAPQPGAPRRYVQAAGAVEGTHPGLGCGRTR